MSSSLLDFKQWHRKRFLRLQQELHGQLDSGARQCVDVKKFLERYLAREKARVPLVEKLLARADEVHAQAETIRVIGAREQEEARKRREGRAATEAQAEPPTLSTQAAAAEPQPADEKDKLLVHPPKAHAPNATSTTDDKQILSDKVS